MTGATTSTSNKSNIPEWNVSGDWFDVCKCNIPCPCTFAQAPTTGDCEGILAYHIKKGNYGQATLDGLNVLALGSFKGNIWAGDGTTKADIGLFFDEKANEQQRQALNMIFSGKAGGFMAEFAKLIGEVRGVKYAPIKFEVADDLTYWSAEIPGKVVAKAEALTGPMTPPDKRVQTINAPGSEVDQDQLQHGENLWPMKPTRWVSNGKEKVSQASIFHLTGAVLRKPLNAYNDNRVNVIPE